MTENRDPKTALVTGAASGIGLAFAHECASRGWNLVCVDINEKGLVDAAENIRNEYHVEVLTLAQNLAERDAAEKCLAFCDDNRVEIDFLINNAGVFFFAPLIDANPKKVEIMSDLHVYCLTRMCMLFGQRMKERRFGYILNVSSMSAWMAMPGISMYNASKAYVRSLSQSLYYELKPWNVGVTAVCPGGINTQLFGLSDKWRKFGVRSGILMEPEDLAKRAVIATLAKKSQTIPGLLNHFFTFAVHNIPDPLVFFFMRHLKVYNKFLKEKS